MQCHRWPVVLAHWDGVFAEFSQAAPAKIHRHPLRTQKCAIVAEESERMRSATVRGEGVISVDGREGHSATAGGSQEPIKQQQKKKNNVLF